MYLYMKQKILIFGANGQLGHDLLRTLSPEYEVIGVGHDRVDITNIVQVSECIKNELPNIVINAAAYNKVEEAEQNPQLAYQVNAIGTYQIARAAKENNIPILHVSTDYVFDGTTVDGFAEDDYVRPLNVYGASKEAGETLVRISNPKHWIVRTSALFGIHTGGGKGYNFVTRMISIAKEKKEVKVVADQWTTPTYTLDLALGIKKIILNDVPFGTYHLVNEGSTTWHHFAQKIFEFSALSPTLIQITTAQSGTKINRPKKSILKNTKLKSLGIMLPTWEDATKRYLRELNTK